MAQAVARRREAIDAPDGGEVSDGVRPGRRPQPALHAGRQGGLTNGMGAVSDGASSACVDHVPHDTRCMMRRKRIKAGRVRERIERWRHAGLLDGKARMCPDTGSPHGSVRAPL